MMVLGWVAVGLLICAGYIVREHRLANERARLYHSLDQLRMVIDAQRQQLARANEDLYVLHAILVEHNVLDEGELARGRIRLVEAPRRMAQERDAMARHLKVSPTQLVVEEDRKLH